MAKRMMVGCRDCKMCTGNAFTGGGRSMGRGLADISTLGITALARKKCKVCGHPMSEHLGQQAQAVTVPQVYETPSQPAVQRSSKPNPARWVLQATGQHRWWDGHQWSNFFSPDANSPDPVAAAAAAQAPIEPPAPVAAAAATSADPVAQIKQLAELRDAGILTEEEFAAKKAEILARM